MAWLGQQLQREIMAKIVPEFVTACAGQLTDNLSGWVYVRLDHHSPWPITLHEGSQDAAPGNNQMNNTFKMLSTSSLH